MAPIFCHAKSAYVSQGLWRGLLQRHLLLPPIKVPSSLFARNRPLIVYFASLEIQREEAREQLDIG
jgi:hypothetical protein